MEIRDAGCGIRTSMFNVERSMFDVSLLRGQRFFFRRVEYVAASSRTEPVGVAPG